MAPMNGTDRIDLAAQPPPAQKPWQPILISALVHASLLLALAGWTTVRGPASGPTIHLAFHDDHDAVELDSVEITPAERPQVDPPPEQPAVVADAVDPPADMSVPEFALDREAPAETDWYHDLHAPPAATRVAPPGGAAGAGATSLTSAVGTGDGPDGRQTGSPIRFFGSEAYAEKVVFVLDRSSSMQGLRLAVLKREFIDCLARLDPQTQFNVIFFGYRFYERDHQGLRPATDENKAEMLRWVRAMGASETTVVAPAIERALRYEPDVIFFLTDGDFSPWVIRNIVRKNTRRIPIHTIGLKNARGRRVLLELARQNGGRFTAVP